MTPASRDKMARSGCQPLCRTRAEDGGRNLSVFCRSVLCIFPAPEALPAPRSPLPALPDDARPLRRLVQPAARGAPRRRRGVRPERWARPRAVDARAQPAAQNRAPRTSWPLTTASRWRASPSPGTPASPSPTPSSGAQGRTTPSTRCARCGASTRTSRSSSAATASRRSRRGASPARSSTWRALSCTAAPGPTSPASRLA